MAKINREEYKILKGLDDKRKWIARDSKGDYVGQLFAYLERPFKIYDEGEWDYGRGIHPIDIHRFQFIQWEDEEPYLISELIEEYESEEKEVKKDKKWLVDKWTKERNETGVHDPMYQFISEFIADINQLEETEDLTTDWIKDNQLMWTSIHGAEYYVPANKLYGKIVPKQELPVIPKFVDDYIKWYENSFIYTFDTDTEYIIYLLEVPLDFTESERVKEWRDKSGNAQKLIDAHRWGYEVEERELTVKEVIEEHIELLKKQEVAVDLKPYYDLWEELKDE